MGCPLPYSHGGTASDGAAESRKFLCIALAVELSAFACAQERLPDVEQPVKEELIFQSGFELDCIVVARGSEADICGKDASVAAPNDWTEDFDKHPEVGAFCIQYQGGTESQRSAKIIAEPGNPRNHVLHFWLNEPNVDGKKGRIQARVNGGENAKLFLM